MCRHTETLLFPQGKPQGHARRGALGPSCHRLREPDLSWLSLLQGLLLPAPLHQPALLSPAQAKMQLFGGGFCSLESQPAETSQVSPEPGDQALGDLQDWPSSAYTAIWTGGSGRNANQGPTPTCRRLAGLLRHPRCQMEGRLSRGSWEELPSPEGQSLPDTDSGSCPPTTPALPTLP